MACILARSNTCGGGVRRFPGVIRWEEGLLDLGQEYSCSQHRGVSR